MKVQKHYYLLPDGTKVDNMKDGCAHLGKASNTFKDLVKRGTIKKITVNNQVQNGNGKEERTTRQQA
ncbi:hypothetical protein [Carboxylicivirga marina]|uniref:Uncharacterized protein n=1 Tax=Carboxylicivirga marina TaxID=2800988 RepID=A0ABS1HN92_9BACT|nr:hypothetical protein [Carboxylicivirga marina]MBK3518910.1 hypothetical protein [Carboxylicivirga marina]